MPRPVLVLGFGPFMDIVDNPSAAVARAVHGRSVRGRPVVGVEMPVSYQRGPQLTVDLVARHDPALVLGIGVAANRGVVTVERWGRRVGPVGAADVDGARWELSVDESASDAVLPATIDVDAFAAALGARVSDDAGTYVCNAWLYRVRQRLGDTPPVGFVHLPTAGLDPDLLLAGLSALLAPVPLVG